MKLRNKKTGEIDDVSIVHSANKIKGVVEHEDGVQCLFAYTLKEFNEEWEDVKEEPKEYWYINGYNEPEKVNFGFPIDNMESLREIGFLFGSKEETEKAVEKLKSFHSLKIHDFMFDGWYYGTDGNIVILANAHEFNDMEEQDLTKVFGEKIC